MSRYLCGHVSMQNVQIWTEESPHTVQQELLQSINVGVRCAVSLCQTVCWRLFQNQCVRITKPVSVLQGMLEGSSRPLLAVLLQYCGVAPKGRSIERLLLANDYAHVAASWVTDRFIPYATIMNATEKSLRNNTRTATNLKPFSTQQLTR
jgi:hypothetical protein